MRTAKQTRGTRQSDDRIHPVVWFLLALWTTIRGVLGIIISIGVFGGIVGLTVMAILDAGPEEVLVPNVVGMPLAEAQQAAATAGLELAVGQEVYDAKVPHGNITETRPAGGTTTKIGRRIEGVLSLGAREVKVPKVVGQSLSSAEKVVGDAGLRVGTVSRQANEAPAERVLKQTPAAGEVVGRDSRIDLLVSGGEDFGSVTLEDGRKLHFRTVVVRVPAGESLQRVIIRARSRDGEYHRTFYNRVRRPGDEVRADIYVATGQQLQVEVARETVLEKTF